MVERCPDKTEVEGPIPSMPTKVKKNLVPKIIYEDKNFLAVNKPAGMITHPASKEKVSEGDSLMDWALKKYPEIKKVGEDTELRAGIVHRLDKDTSGIILIPKNQKYFEYLKNLFQRHLIKKTYFALVHGAPKEKTGTINLAIGIRSGSIRRTTRGGKMPKEAQTSYELVKVKTKAGKIYSLLRILPKTGRTHQIRVHLKAIGLPICGDEIYGLKRGDEFKRLMLHAESIEFPVSFKKKLKIRSALPKEFSAFTK